MSIKISNLTKNFDGQTAVNDLCFEINPGEIVGFLGPNGAGKSTTMKIINGLLKPDAGTVHINDVLVEIDQNATKKLIGYLPEHNPLYTEMYVREFLDFMSQVHEIRDAARIENMIEMVGLKTEAHKKISQLSKGYKQRTGLAQALIHSPQVLILDEPTTGLDPNQLVEVRSLIKEISQGKTTILSTHIMQEVEAICTRVIIINKGQLVADLDMKTLKEPLENVFHKLTA